jgi:hypothetical protein
MAFWVYALMMLFLFPVVTSNTRPLVLDFIVVGEIGDTHRPAAIWLNELGHAEPGIDVTLVPLRAFAVGGISDDDLYRLSRLYFPRSMERLLNYHVLIFNSPRLNLLTLKQQYMLVDFAGTKVKASLAFTLSYLDEVQIPWMRSPVSEAFPLDMEEFHFADVISFGTGPLRLAPGLPPVFSVFKSTGIFDAPEYGRRPCYTKEGATIWIYMTRGPPELPEAPAFISWPYEESETWAFGIHPGSFLGAPAYVDMVYWEFIIPNIFYYNSGSEMFSFEEAVQKRSVKTQFSYFRDTSSMFQSIVDFVSLVGGNTFQAESIMSEAEQTKSEADLDYLEQIYGEAGQKMVRALQLGCDAMDEAQRAKDRALVWIYVSEWLVTTAVGLLCGMVLWSLMVKRKFYRDITTTQLRHK